MRITSTTGLKYPRSISVMGYPNVKRRKMVELSIYMMQAIYLCEHFRHVHTFQLVTNCWDVQLQCKETETIPS